MKKFLLIIIALALVFSLAACTSADKTPDKDEPAVKDPLELLNTVWNSYKDEEKFPASGGDASEENMTMNAPGSYSIEDAQALDSALGFPAAEIGKIDGAASLMHMMNANTFTCGVFHVKDSADLTALTAAIKDNIMQRQWMCGFPDKLVCVTVGDYIVAFFGETEIVDTFAAKLAAAYDTAQTVCDEPIA